MKKNWNKANWNYKKNKKKSESVLLNLDSRKAYYKLGWKPVLKFKEVIKYTTVWYKEFYEKKKILIISHFSKSKNLRIF